MKKISVIIPFLNEAANIPHLTSELNDFCKLHSTVQWEIIFVNDGSIDNSVELLTQSSPDSFNGKVITLSKNYGSHAALRAGILNATGDLVSFIYADLQDPLQLLLDMYAKLQKENANIVWATRSTLPAGMIDRNFSKGYAYLMKKFVNQDYPEKGFDIALFDKKVVDCLNQNIEANSSIFLQILTLGFTQTTIYYEKQQRKAGKSKWTLSKKVKLLVDSFISFSYFPIRIVTIIGFLMFLTGISYSLYLIYRKLIIGDLTPGWAITGTILMLGFGVTNISLGIIAEYLWRTLDASRKRPVFIIKDIIEIKR